MSNFFKYISIFYWALFLPQTALAQEPAVITCLSSFEIAKQYIIKHRPTLNPDFIDNIIAEESYRYKKENPDINIPAMDGKTESFKYGNSNNDVDLNLIWELMDISCKDSGINAFKIKTIKKIVSNPYPTPTNDLTECFALLDSFEPYVSHIHGEEYADKWSSPLGGKLGIIAVVIEEIYKDSPKINISEIIIKVREKKRQAANKGRGQFVGDMRREGDSCNRLDVPVVAEIKRVIGKDEPLGAVFSQ